MGVRRISLGLVIPLLTCALSWPQELDADPNRVFITPLKWERVAGAPHSERLRYVHGTLIVLYLEGVYAEVTASFIKTDEKQPIRLNLNEGYMVRLGTWSRTDDDNLIRIESREVAREKLVQMIPCRQTPSGQVCTPAPEPALPGPLVSHTCRLERQSSVHIADTIVCNGGLVVSYPKKAIDLVDFPNIVRQLVAKENSGNGSKTK
jgi:hypothetical protein